MSHDRRRLRPSFPSGWLALALPALVFATAAPVLAQSAEDCLACHSDDSLTATRHGKEVSAFVDGEKLEASKHADLACVDCHADLAGKGDGHEDDVAPVDCASCHEDEVRQAGRGIHSKEVDGRTAATCAECHKPHELKRGREALAACDSCHGDVAALQHASLHGKAAARGDQLAPNCITCHGSHAILPHGPTRSRRSP